MLLFTPIRVCALCLPSWLSRKSCREEQASNPESGELRYAYNEAGSVVSKTDANGIVTTMGYDALQRPLTKTYPDGTTPEVSYQWDTVFQGALTRVENSVTVREQLSFDPMGRVLSSRQTTNGSVYNFSYQYNLAGGLAQATYPAGRVSQVKQKATPAAQEVTVAQVTQYWEHGAAQQLSLGDGLVSETTLFDDARLQLRRITAGTVAAGNWEQKLHYCGSGDETQQCVSNNGNILKQRGYGGAENDAGAIRRHRGGTGRRWRRIAGPEIRGIRG